MSNKTVPLHEATRDQMVQFATNYLGLSIPGNTKDETLLAKIRSAWAKDEIPVDEATEHQPMEGSPPPPVTQAQAKPADDKVRIIIAVTEEAGGNEAVPVAVNGSAMLIPRGQEVDIPYKFYEALKNAVRNVYDPLPDGGFNPTPRKVQAYPFQTIHKAA